MREAAVDAGALANILRRPVTQAEDGGRPLASLNLKLAIAVVAAQGGRAELLRELQALAGRYPTLRLVQSPGAPARLEAGGLRFVVPAVLRDALLAAAANAAARPGAAAAPPAQTAQGSAQPAAQASSPASQTSSPASPAVQAAPSPTGAAAPRAAAAASPAAAPAGAAPAGAAGAAAAAADTGPSLAAAALRAAMQWPAALAVQATAPRLRGAAADAPAVRVALPLAAALLDETTDPPAAAARLQTAVRDSGLFGEAQLGRALLRERGAAAEAPAVRDPMRSAAQLPPAERAAAQVEMLRRDTASFVLQAWGGQTMELDLGREPLDAEGRGNAAADGARVFVATLRLDLPQVGVVTVTLRLANATLAALVEAGDPQRWEAALPDLAARLLARGLHPAALQAVAAATEAADVGAA